MSINLLRISTVVIVAILSLSGAVPQSLEAQSAGAESAPIRLNSMGYLPTAAKIATIPVSTEEFFVRDAQSGREVLRGSVAKVRTSAPDKPLFLADFSDLRRPGQYRLEIASVADSPEFTIAEDVFNAPFYHVARGMYLWRCGTEVSGEFAGHTFHHDPCHLEDAYLDHAGGTPGQTKDGAGGWHDAGDYNKYIVNSAFTVGMMLQAWEHFSDRLATLNLNIPESENGVPDYLDEIRWELEWMRKMQADDGRVYHMLATLEYGPFIPADEEAEPRYFSQWGTAATASFSAVMAQASRVYRPFDEAFANECLAAAEKAYAFLREHPEEQNPPQAPFKMLPYQTSDRDDRLWAAAELWETTGKQAYLDDFERSGFGGRNRRRLSQQNANVTPNPPPPPFLFPRRQEGVSADWDWGDAQNLGTFTYLLSSRPGRNPARLAKLREDAIRSADGIVGVVRRDPYGRPLGLRYYWGCNGTVARLTMNLEVAHRLTGEPHFRATMLDSLNYLFGRNPFGRSFVTGLGHNPPMFPHDRRSGGDTIDPPWPGYLVGGPWPGPTDWHDEQDDYRTNEIAINWNGALIYALAAFVDPSTFNTTFADIAVSRDAHQ